MARYVELRRHTDNDGDVLSPAGVRQALEIGTGLAGGYDLMVSTGAQRATQTLACFLAAAGARVAGGVVVEAGLRSEVEEPASSRTRARRAWRSPRSDRHPTGSSGK